MTDIGTDHGPGPAGPGPVDVLDSKVADVGGTAVRRTIPQRGRRTVGPWCFVDRMGPTAASATAMQVGPHPHTGLQTVTWLLDGGLLHRDSLGSEQPLRPGQLNLMTAGAGIAHTEESPLSVHATMHGLQLWLALPDATVDGAPAFEHHGDLPRLDLPGLEATVLIGAFADAESPARQDSPTIGIDLRVEHGRTVVPLDPTFEHLVVLTNGDLTVSSSAVERVLVDGQAAYLPVGTSEMDLASTEGARVLVLGGAPFESPVMMWWNFVARTRDELAIAVTEWNAGAERFGVVDSHLARIASPVPTWVPASRPDPDQPSPDRQGS